MNARATRSSDQKNERKPRLQRPEAILESIANDAEKALQRAERLDQEWAAQIMDDIKGLGRKAEQLADQARGKRERFA